MVFPQPHTPSNQNQISLNLSREDIELLRYSWSLMLLEEGEIGSSSNFPGLFPVEPRRYQQNHIQSSRSSTRSGTSVLIGGKSTVMNTSLFCRQFYANLLKRDKGLEKMFPSIKHQAVAFASLLSLVVAQIEDLSILQDYLIELGKRHARILNVEPIHFELMGEALIKTFHQRFGIKFDKQLELLWIRVYLYLANSILQFGIDPIMEYEDYRSGPPLLHNNNSRKPSVDDDDLNFHDGKSLSTQNTSFISPVKTSGSTSNKKLEKQNVETKPIKPPPTPTFWMSLI